jgi:hypothetical protein
MKSTGKILDTPAKLRENRWKTDLKNYNNDVENLVWESSNRKSSLIGHNFISVYSTQSKRAHSILIHNLVSIAFVSSAVPFKINEDSHLLSLT